MIEKKIVVCGKRKTAIAKATIEAGDGKIIYNEKDISLLGNLERLQLEEPLFLTREVLGDLKFDIRVLVRGGGQSSQIDAARLAIARAILEFTKNKEIKIAFLAYDRNLLVADTRRKEAYKPGTSKARAKRQTSYR